MSFYHKNRLVKALFSLILAVLLLPQLAWASIPLGSGRKTATGTVELYGCLQANDYYIVNFAAYPLADNAGKKPATAECVNISATGQNMISLDLLDRDVRKKKVALKLVDEHGRLLQETPFAMPKQGIISTQANFTQAGKYELQLYVQDEDFSLDKTESALHIPLTIAIPGAEPATRHTMTGFFILIGLLMTILAVTIPKFLKPTSA